MPYAGLPRREDATNRALVFDLRHRRRVPFLCATVKTAARTSNWLARQTVSRRLRARTDPSVPETRKSATAVQE
jgi:hypothetical protein